jgi:hypothetical protein
MAVRPAKQLLSVLGAVVARGGLPADECWLWTAEPFWGPLNRDGYGVVQFPRGGVVPAHKLAWEWANGVKVPADCEVDHGCRQRQCVNPAHLQAVDGYGNTARQSLTAEQHRSLL